uniref:Uncharacterized protein n=1 Tax=Glossina austeni TaxID=7395 RepID=A0A1A9UM87_GLOAU
MSSKLAEGISFCSTDEGATFSLAVAVAAELFSFSLTTVAVAAAAPATAAAEDATEAPTPSIASFVVRETAFAAVDDNDDADDDDDDDDDDVAKSKRDLRAAFTLRVLVVTLLIMTITSTLATVFSARDKFLSLRHGIFFSNCRHNVLDTDHAYFQI